MSNAVKDQNYVSTILGVSSADLTTPTRIAANPVTGALLIDSTSIYSSLDARYLKLDASNDPLTGDLTFSGAQKIIGGSSTTADLTFQTTSGVGATGADMHFLVGNNGATEAMTILNSGNVGIGTTSPEAKLHVGAGNILLDNAQNLQFKDSTGALRNVVSMSAADNVSITGRSGVSDIFIQGGGVFIVKANSTIGMGLSTGIGARLHIQGAASGKSLIVQSNATTPGNLTEWQNSSGTALASINSSGFLGIGAAASDYTLINTNKSFESDANQKRGFQSVMSITGTGDDTAFNNFGGSFTVNTQSTFSGNVTGGFGGLTGGYFSAAHNGPGTVTTAYSGSFNLTQGNASGVITTADILRTGGSVANSIGTLAQINIVDLTGAGTITNNYGLYINSLNKGTNKYAIVTNAGNIVFNEGGDANTDVRIEGDTDANLFFTDASADRVGIGNNAPNNKLDVTGTIQADGLRLDVTPTAEVIVATHTITISVNGTNYKIPIVAA